MCLQSAGLRILVSAKIDMSLVTWYGVKSKYAINFTVPLILKIKIIHFSFIFKFHFAFSLDWNYSLDFCKWDKLHTVAAVFNSRLAIAT